MVTAHKLVTGATACKRVIFFSMTSLKSKFGIYEKVVNWIVSFLKEGSFVLSRVRLETHGNMTSNKAGVNGVPQ